MHKEQEQNIYHISPIFLEAEPSLICKLCKALLATADYSAWKVLCRKMKRRELMVYFHVHMRRACRNWSVAVRLRTQKRLGKASRESYECQHRKIPIESAHWNTNGVCWSHVVWASWFDYVFHVVFACGVCLAFWNRSSWRRAKIRFFVYGGAEDEDRTMVKYRFLTGCGERRG